MDIDSDGAKNSLCRIEPGSDTRSVTSFQGTVKKFGISELDASIHDYVVFGNADDGNTPGYTTFDPKAQGV